VKLPSTFNIKVPLKRLSDSNLTEEIALKGSPLLGIMSAPVVFVITLPVIDAVIELL
jgi:hypothetical protein